MRLLIYLLFLITPFCLLDAQELPNLPIPLGAGTAEVWQNDIYFFGGSNNWAGSVVYPRVYRFDGISWTHHDSIPDNNLWDVESVLVGDDVYLISGWPGGAGSIRRYNLNSGNWTYLNPSANTQTWGTAAEYVNGKIYLFDSTGKVFIYDIAANEWSNGTQNTASGTLDLSSILYQGNIYIIGFSDSSFYEYDPHGDDWTALAKSPYHVGACAMGIIDNLIYCVGGNTGGGTGAAYNTVIVYDITTNEWRTDSLRIAKRHWMATAEYRGGLYVVGGIDSNAVSVEIVEEIVPQGTSTNLTEEFQIPHDLILHQNFPNPFNPSTTINFGLPSAQYVRLRIYNVLGQEVSILVNHKLPAGIHSYQWSPADFSSGIYYYVLEANGSRQVKKMIFNK